MNPLLPLRAWRTTSMLALTMVVLALFAPVRSVMAQAPPPYHGFRPYHSYDDTTFALGAISMFDADLAVDSLHFTFTQLYHDRPDLRYYFMPSLWQPADTNESWDLWRRNRFYSGAMRRNYKVIYEPNEISGLAWATRSMETYTGLRGDSCHSYEFDTKSEGAHDSIFNHHFWGITMPAAATPRDTALALGSRGTKMGMKTDSNIWKELKKPDGTPYADSSRYFDLGLTIQIKDSIFQNTDLDSVALLAYAKLWRRERAGQPGPEGCRCNFYSGDIIPDSVAVTKTAYLDPGTSPIITKAKDGITPLYREPRFIFRFVQRSDTVHGDTVLRDTVLRRVADHIDTSNSGGMPKYDTTFRFEVAAIYADTALRDGQIFTTAIPNEDAGFFGWGSASDSTTHAGVYCRNLLAALKKRGLVPQNTVNRSGAVEEADFCYDVFSTRRVPLTFLRGRTSPHLVSPLLRGEFNSLVNTVVDSIDAPGDASTPVRNPTDSLLMHVGITGENQLPSYYSEKILSSKVQHRMLFNRPADQRGMWNNPIGDHAAYRVLMGDLDSTDIRMMHMQATQAYHWSIPVPVFYGNPDSMSAAGNSTYYRVYNHDAVPAPGDTSRSRLVAGTSPADYAWYTRLAQHAHALDRDQMTDATVVARQRYSYLVDAPYPVWKVVQVHGWMGATTDRLTGVFDNDWRPVTPEEISAQSFMTLNCGMDGIMFSDFSYCGQEVGVIHYYTFKHDAEYDTLNTTKPEVLHNPNWTAPKMWIGFRSRFDAVKRTTSEFYDKILPVYRKLDRDGVRIAADSVPSMAAFPMLDSVLAEKAVQYDTTTKPFAASGAFDPRAETYMEVTCFKPGPYQLATEGPDTRFLLFTNRRTWPVDFHTYSDSVAAIFNSASADTSRFVKQGLGNIDVRRPVVVFKPAAVFADSVDVQRVGATTWHRYAVGVRVALDWLTPGWGAMYRVKPVAGQVSEHGVAWNNAVHAENFSSDSVQLDRIVTYERDSVIYLRALDTAGSVSREWMISDAADTVTAIGSNGKRTRRASNMRPAVAVIRDEAARTGTARSGLKCMVAWERRDSAGRASVELFVMDSVASRANGLTHATARKRLTDPAPPLKAWMQLAPSIVGLDSGWVVAWGATNDPGGIQLVAVRAGLDTTTTLNAEDTSGIVRAKMPRTLVGTNLWWPADSVCQFPSLAYHRNWSRMFLTGGIFSYQSNGDTVPPAGMPLDTIGGGVNVYGSFHAVRLAYQQGMRNNTSWRIMYNTIGVAFPLHHDYLPGKPQLWLSHAEHVSNSVEGCEDLHPSIAVDSTRTTVAFETVQGTNTITLRQRDTVHLDATGQPLAWATPVYRWGDLTLTRPPGSILNLHAYANPSVTQFPGLRTTQLAGVPEGVLVWQWTNAPNARRNRLRLYHFGEKGVDTSLADAADPTMMLAPNLSASRTTAFATSGILQRGSLAERVTAARPTGDSAFYYPASVVNTQLNPSKVFTKPQSFGTQIVGYFTIAGLARQFSSCQVAAGAVRVGLFLPNVPMTKRRSDSVPAPLPPPPWTNIGLPPAFFASNPGAVTSANDAAQVARTGAFVAGDSAVILRRVVYGDDSLVAWLNTQPFDKGAGAPANIYVNAQLVRASDGAVLWMGAIVNTRTLGHDTLDESIAVPVNLYAPRDTVVYIRVLAALSPGIQYEAGAGFAFVEQPSDSAIALKGAQPESRAVPGTPTAIGVAMIPNPVHAGEGALHVLMQSPGTATIAVYDLLGASVKTLPDLVAGQPGEYTVPVDLGDLRNGLYVVEVRMGSSRGTTRFTVMR